MHALRPLSPRDADRVRRGTGGGEDRAGRRAAGRRRGPGRQAVRRAGGQAARPRPGRGGDRARQGLCHQRGQAFKFEPRGKRRIHSKPNAGEIKACKWWLEREFAALSPAIVVALGATAAQALLGHAVSVMRERGRQTQMMGRRGLVTVHPSYLLRIPDEDAKAAAYEKFVADLKKAAALADAD
ncbi:MAG: uracil-DNA glycosylase family protein [Rhizomicrobium sp.]